MWEEFKNSTLIVIAHRLDHVLGYDKVVVFDEGRIVEFGSPNELLEKPDGKLNALWLQQGGGSSKGKRLE